VELDFWLKRSEENVNSLRKALNESHPKAIFLPFFDEMHPDHVMTNEILRLSLEKSFLKNDQILVENYPLKLFSQELFGDENPLFRQDNDGTNHI